MTLMKWTASLIAIAGMSLLALPVRSQSDQNQPDPENMAPGETQSPSSDEKNKAGGSQQEDTSPAASPATARPNTPKPISPAPSATPKTSAKEEKEEEHKPADPDTGTSTLSHETLGLLPNPFEQRGLKFTATYIGEAVSNPVGGLRQGAVYEGRLNLAVDLDLAKLAGWSGATVHGNIFQIHGRGLSRDYIGNLMPVSSIEALETTRLYELWLEQKLANEKVSVRAGQLAADTEFITSKYTDVFITSTFGWPAITALNLPSGGPSPPLAAVGARLKVDLSDSITFLAAIFNGDPAGPGAGDPQTRNRYGLNFRVNDPPFMISELQYAYNHEKGAKGLPGTIKVGGWYHAGLFDDQRFTLAGLSRADPNGSEQPAQLRGDFGLYSVFEQQLLRFGTETDERGVGVFGRASISPSDRNLVDLYADGGVNVIGPFAARSKDKFGLGVAYTQISSSARDLDRDFAFFSQSNFPTRSYELLIALNYLIQVTDGWTINPTIQYIVHPGGGYVTPPITSTPQPVKDAIALGARSVVKF
jgi:porin